MNMPLASFHYDNRFVNELPGDTEGSNQSRQVYQACWSRVLPTLVSRPQLVAWSPDAASLLDLSNEDVKSSIFSEIFSGNRILPGMQPYAACYGGHQFGSWAGQLGDGRAITLTEIINQKGERWEIQLKGVGRTPYSRFADGRAVLRSSLREFLCSEAMYFLRVPTTRALSLILTGESVARDMFYDGNIQHELGAIVCRVAPSFIRFGNFEIFAARNDQSTLEKLINFTINRDFPDLTGDMHNKQITWFHEVCARTARLIVEWLRVGFVHGVMNTDNMSIIGLTIDYGPYGFLDNYDPDWTPNTTDRSSKRYVYANQANIALWNLHCLAYALTPFLPKEALQEGLLAYQNIFETEYQRMLFAKFGFANTPDSEGLQLANEAFELLKESEMDMTIFFRRLADLDIQNPEVDLLNDAYYEIEQIQKQRQKWAAWLAQYSAYSNQYPLTNRKESMNAVNPLYILRNYLVQEAIDLANKNDYSRIYELMEVIKQPYKEDVRFQKFANKRPDWAKNQPGCSTLSCSS